MANVLKSPPTSIPILPNDHPRPAKYLALATAMHTNMALDEIKRKVYEYKDRIQKEHWEFSVHTLLEKWFGQDRNTRTLLEVLRLSIRDLEKLVAKGVIAESIFTYRSQAPFCRAVCLLFAIRKRDDDQFLRQNDQKSKKDCPGLRG